MTGGVSSGIDKYGRVSESMEEYQRVWRSIGVDGRVLMNIDEYRSINGSGVEYNRVENRRRQTRMVDRRRMSRIVVAVSSPWDIPNVPEKSHQSPTGGTLLA